MPDQTDNASERPDLRQERVIFAPSTDYVYVHDRVVDSWEAWERADDGRDGVAYDTEQLPDDAGPLFDAELWPHPEKRRADAAEAKLRDVQRRLDNALTLLRATTAQRNDAQRAGLNFVRRLNGVRSVLARGLDKARGPYEILANVEAALDGRAIPEPTLAASVTIRREDLERTEPSLVDVIAAGFTATRTLFGLKLPAHIHTGQVCDEGRLWCAKHDPQPSSKWTADVDELRAFLRDHAHETSEAGRG